jgi:hypothetical protein
MMHGHANLKFKKNVLVSGNISTRREIKLRSPEQETQVT